MDVASLDRLIAGSRGDWPEDVVHATRDPKEKHLSLYPTEEAAIVGANTRRRLEFAAGRSAARAVLKKLGFPHGVIPMDQNRAPIWPAGTIGSLSHTADVCIGVAALSQHVQAIGIDVENLAPLESKLPPYITDPEELACIDSPPGLAALQIFSMKEAAYKAQYPLSQTFIDFDTLKVTPDGLCFNHTVPPFAKGTILPVQQWTGSSMCLSLCVLKRRPT
ncbi:4'-phosphopantetheinyl transferase family protein [Halomonas elongata]|uniref:4'-phosphopantetheinyl transferase family protein n=1 Tax=Halomonas elongata TaxID=2746 RepID=UPI0023B0D5F3|nr:4'-phosphopantetheinyl transferase superfamily protein [Halomonas elongata]